MSRDLDSLFYVSADRLAPEKERALLRYLHHYNPEISAREVEGFVVFDAQKKTRIGLYDAELDRAFGYCTIGPEGLRAQSDRFMRAPLFYAHQSERLLALTNLPPALYFAHQRTLCDKEVASHLWHSLCSHRTRTLFKNERALCGNHTLMASAKSKRFRLEKKSDIKAMKLPENSNKRAELLRHLIDRSVASIDKCAVSLSGGLDASSLFAALYERRKNPLALTVGRRSGDYESAFTKKVCAHFNAPLHTTFKDDDALFDDWTRARDDCYFPREDWVPTRRKLYEKMFELGARSVVTGHGADPLFTSGPHALKERFNESPLKGLSTFVRSWLMHDARLGTGLLARKKSAWPRPAYLKSAFVARPRRELRNNECVGALRKRALDVLQNTVWTSAFYEIRRDARAAKLDVHLPFLNKELVRFALSLTPGFECHNKEILRASQRSRLPAQITLRPKTPLKHEAKISVNIQSLRRTLENLRHSEAEKFLKKECFEAFDVTQSQSIDALEDVFPAFAFANWLSEQRQWKKRWGTIPSSPSEGLARKSEI